MTIHFKEFVIALKQKKQQNGQTNFEFCNMHL